MNKFFEDWKPLFPEYKHADSLGIVGMAPTSRGDAPYNNPEFDIWGLNEAAASPWFKQDVPAMMFQVHPIFDVMRTYNRNDEKHWDWLRAEHNFPIMMQTNYRDIPNAVRYPLEDAINAFGQYFTSTPAYMLALGILMGYKKIGIWGIEMSADSEYIYQKSAFEYLIGFAKGLGIEIYLPPKCWLLRGNLYAYEDLRAASRTYFQFREAGLEGLARQARDEMWCAQGEMNGIQKLMMDEKLPHPDEVRPYLAEKAVEQEAVINKAHQKDGAASGALGEIKQLINWFDAQNCVNDHTELKDLS